MAEKGKKAASGQSFETLPIAAKIFLLFLLLAVLAAAYYFALHMNLEEEIQNAESQNAQLQQNLVQAQQRQEEYLRLTQELASREAIDRQNKRILPANAEIPAFLQDLNRLAELSGLQMKLVEPRPEERQQLYLRIPVSLQVEGKYHQLAKFFYNVSQLERAINMENITMNLKGLRSASRNPNEETEAILEVAVLATTFRRPAPAGANR